MEQTSTIKIESEQPQTPSEVYDVIAPMKSRRGMIACLRDGWRIFALHVRLFFFQLLPASLLVGIFSFLFLACLDHVTLQYWVPEYALMQGVENPEMIKTSFALPFAMKAWLSLSFVACILACIVARGIVWYQIHVFAHDGELPKRRFLFHGKEIWNHVMRYLKYDVLCVLLMTIIIGCGILLGMKYGALALVLLPVAIYVDIMLSPGRYFYMVENKSLKDSLRFTLRHGTRRWGGFFVVALLTAIPVVSVSLGIATAFVPYVIGSLFNAKGMLLGDPSGIPAYVPYVMAVIVVVGLSLCFMLSALRTWTIAFKTASNIENQKKTIPRGFSDVK